MSLRVENVHKRLAGRAVLGGVNLACEGAGAFVLLGKNGTGKSTLLRVIVGILEPDEGDVRLFGESITGGRVEGRRRLGYVPEAGDAPPYLTVREFVSLVAALKRAPFPPQSLVERLGVGPTLSQRIGSLSLGQRRRACLLSALVGAPWLLVLDEPTNGLDPDGIGMLRDMIRERTADGGATLLATHDLGFASAVSGHRLELSGGVIVARTEEPGDPA